jgi:membrane protein
MRISIKSVFDSVGYYARGIYNRGHDEKLTLLASGIAFNGILCLIPLILLFSSLLGILLDSSELAIQRVDEALSAVFPNQPYAQSIKQAIKQAVGDIILYRTSFGLVGAAVLIWTGTSLFSAIRNALHTVYHVTSNKNLFISILEDIVWVFSAGILFLALNLLTWMSSLIDTLLALLPPLRELELSLLTTTLPRFTEVAITLLMFFIVYRFIPDVKPPSRVAWLSAITTTALWLLAAAVFGWYLAEFHSFSKVYGAYAFLLVLLVWVYYSASVFVFGGIVGQLYRERRESRRT